MFIKSKGELTEKEIETIVKLGEGFTKYLESDEVSEITETNKPFQIDIFPEEIGLPNLKVDGWCYNYKDSVRSCHPRKMRTTRNFSCDKNFHSLDEGRKKLILDFLIPELKENFTYIYKIVEIRHIFIVDGYVQNNIDYICWGDKIGW